MGNIRSVKKALLLSALSVLVCISMLAGTTFAWFTDSASTAVNTIRSGKLDVALEVSYDGETWENAEGETLSFLRANDEDTSSAWEPGGTYELPQLRVVNNGDLALTYTIAITGITGDAKLNEVIEWTITGTDDAHLLAGQSQRITIKGHMSEDAGNEYQDLSITGIALTVYATQYTHEYDSVDNQYDAAAAYDALPAVAVTDIATLKSAMEAGRKAVLANSIVHDCNGSGGWIVYLSESTRKTSLDLNGLNITLKNLHPNADVFRADNGAQIEINGDGIVKSIDYPYGSDMFLASWEGKIVINGGQYYSTTSSPNGMVRADNGGVVEINGGTFQSVNQSTYTLKEGTDGTIIVRGGSFYHFDPSEFVPTGYTVTESDGWYTVSAQ